MLLKTDDDSMVHVGRLWAMLHNDLHPPSELKAQPLGKLSDLYAGRVFSGSQVPAANTLHTPPRDPVQILYPS